jgi:hypothetical protein
MLITNSSVPYHECEYQFSLSFAFVYFLEISCFGKIKEKTLLRVKAIVNKKKHRIIFCPLATSSIYLFRYLFNKYILSQCFCFSFSTHKQCTLSRLYQTALLYITSLKTLYLGRSQSYDFWIYSYNASVVVG